MNQQNNSLQIEQNMQRKDQIIEMLRSNEKDLQINHKFQQKQSQQKQFQQQTQITQQQVINTKKPIISCVDEFYSVIDNLNYNEQSKSDFNFIFQNSLLFYRKNTNDKYQMPINFIDLIMNLKNFKENKIYNLTFGDTHSYLQQYIQIKALQTPNIFQLKNEDNNLQINFKKMDIQIANMCVQKRNKKMYGQILEGSFQKIFYRKTNLQESKNKLQQNISQLRKSLTKDTYLMSDRESIIYQSADQRKRRRDDSFFQYLSFRKKGYWQDTNKSQQISSFLNKISLQRSSTHNRYQKSLQKRQKQEKLYFQKILKNKQLEVKKCVQQNLKKHRSFKQSFQENQIMSKQKQKQIQTFLSKYKSQKPLYEKLDQNYKKWQGELIKTDRKRLDELHEQRRVISLLQFQSHRKKVSQRLNLKKQITAEDLHRIKQEQSQIRNKLNRLFHSKHHSKIKQDEKFVPINQKQVRKQRKQKSLTYSVEVVAKSHQPTIDPFKQRQIQQILDSHIESQNQNPKKIIIKRKKKIIKSGQITQNQNQKDTKQNLNLSDTKNLVNQDIKIQNTKQKSKQQSLSKQVSIQTAGINKIQLNQSKKSVQIQQQEIQIDVDPRKIGDEYLRELRLINEGKSRKKKVNNKQQKQVGKKIFDYSKQKKDHYKIRLTLSQWKRVLESKSKNNNGNTKSNNNSLSKIKIQDMAQNSEMGQNSLIQVNEFISQSNNNKLSNKLLNKLSNKQLNANNKQSLSVKQKALLLDPYVRRISMQSSLYQQQKRNMSKNNISKVLSLNKKLQKCYIQGIKSKLQILKQ